MSAQISKKIQKTQGGTRSLRGGAPSKAAPIASSRKSKSKYRLPSAPLPSKAPVLPPSQPPVVPPSQPPVLPPSKAPVLPPSKPLVVPPSQPPVVPSVMSPVEPKKPANEEDADLQDAIQRTLESEEPEYDEPNNNTDKKDDNKGLLTKQPMSIQNVSTKPKVIPNQLLIRLITGEPKYPIIEYTPSMTFPKMSNLKKVYIDPLIEYDKPLILNNRLNG